MHYVIAPDKFKGSLSGEQVAMHLVAGIRTVDLLAHVVIVPVADGGEGTLDAAISAGFIRHTAQVTGPTGRQIEAAFGVRGGDALIELAQASGLAVLPDGKKNALGAGTRGTGELIRAALDLGCERIILCIGGSASTDGGAGLLQGLGVRLLDSRDDELPGGGAALARLVRIDLSTLDPRIATTEIVLASDVDNPLLGPNGAAVVFGPQKGASGPDVEVLDAALTNLVRVLGEALGPIVETVATEAGSGAAGGAGFAAIAVLAAVREPGIAFVLELTEVADQLTAADLVITGEGSLDEQSLFGKAPVGVARLATEYGVPTYAICGQTTLSAGQLTAAGFEQTFALTDLEADVETCIREAGALLERTGARLALAFQARQQYDLVVRGRQILTVNGIVAGELGVRNGTVTDIAPAGSALMGKSTVLLADDEVLIPGLVDTHVHVNEPGRTEWEGFASATRAAAAGGVTTIIDMPLNSIPPTTSVSALEIKRAVARDQIFVDVGFWGGAIPGNREHLRPLYDAGVFGFKGFLIDSGVDEFPALSADELEQDLAELAKIDALMLVHAEDPQVIDTATQRSGARYSDFLASRPSEAENVAIAEVIARARVTGARVHILHLSSAGALDSIAAARRDGLSISVETCPHYLTLVAEDIPDGATVYKCCPPIREAANRDRLWDGLRAGTIDCIVSDHSPSTREAKQPPGGDFAVAWGGISSLQLGLSLIWTEARERAIPLDQVVHWMSGAPAGLAGLTAKGRIAVGADADFAVFAPDETFTVDARTLKHKNHVTAYDGKRLRGRVRATYLRGVAVDGEIATGNLLDRTIEY
jgi:allantoinase